MYWKRISATEINSTIKKAFDRNVRFGRSKVMGLPISSMDPRIFHKEGVQQSPFLFAMMQNANHGGCPTQGISGDFFEGTEHIENEVIQLCAEQLMAGKPGMQDGYIAAGGTECNVQAAWIFRNLFKRKYKAESSQIAILHSEDTHYSVWKIANLLSVKQVVADVHPTTRQIDLPLLRKKIKQAKKEGIAYFIVVANMGTTMFGTVDDLDGLTLVLDEEEAFYKVHVDGAFGGFTFPFTKPKNNLNFSNTKVTSIGLDAHKMLQAPYGTGVFLIRKGYLNYLATTEPHFMAHKIHTLSGSRSGANAIAVWMILRAFGSKGLQAKVKRVMDLKRKMCAFLDKKKIEYIHDEHMNIVAIHNRHMVREIQHHYNLVPDNHENPTWWKIVLMDHVNERMIQDFLDH
jgi:tyrosine decarboxylase / aspartate 1-decarboxylase